MCCHSMVLCSKVAHSRLLRVLFYSCSNVSVLFFFFKVVTVSFFKMWHQMKQPVMFSSFFRILTVYGSKVPCRYWIYVCFTYKVACSLYVDQGCLNSHYITYKVLSSFSFSLKVFCHWLGHPFVFLLELKHFSDKNLIVFFTYTCPFFYIFWNDYFSVHSIRFAVWSVSNSEFCYA